jgi:hypothetical protein
MKSVNGARQHQEGHDTEDPGGKHTAAEGSHQSGPNPGHAREQAAAVIAIVTPGPLEIRLSNSPLRLGRKRLQKRIPFLGANYSRKDRGSWSHCWTGRDSQAAGPAAWFTWMSSSG